MIESDSHSNKTEYSGVDTARELAIGIYPNTINSNVLKSEHQYSNSPELSRSPKIDINFVLCTHTLQNVDKIVKAIADADVVLIEATGGTLQERQEAEKFYNQVTHNEASFESVPSHFLTQLVSSMKGSNKVIKLVDADESSQAYQAYCSAMSAEDDIQPLMSSTSQLLERVKTFIDLTVESNRQREQLVARQIEDLVTKTTEDKKIAVVAGMAHTPVSHQAYKVPGHEIATSRSFVDTKEKSRTTIIASSPYDMVLRMSRFFPEQEIDSLLLKQVLMGVIVQDFYNRQALELKGKGLSFNYDKAQEMLADLDNIKSKRFMRSSSKQKRLDKVIDRYVQVIDNVDI